MEITPDAESKSVELKAAIPFVLPLATASCIASVSVPEPDVTDPFVTEIVLYSGAAEAPVLARTAPAVEEDESLLIADAPDA